LSLALKSAQAPASPGRRRLIQKQFFESLSLCAGAVSFRYTSKRKKTINIDYQIDIGGGFEIKCHICVFIIGRKLRAVMSTLLYVTYDFILFYLVYSDVIHFPRTKNTMAYAIIAKQAERYISLLQHKEIRLL